MKNNTVEDAKYIIPPLDLSKTKKGVFINKINNDNNKSNLKPEEILQLRKKNFEIEEWEETVKLVGLTSEEIERFFNNKMLNKLINALENFVKIIREKNKNINEIKKENMGLSSQLSQLKNEQINLTNNFIILKEKYRELENHLNKIDRKSDLFDSSMVNSVYYYKIKN